MNTRTLALTLSANQTRHWVKSDDGRVPDELDEAAGRRISVQSWPFHAMHDDTEWDAVHHEGSHQLPST